MNFYIDLLMFPLTIPLWDMSARVLLDFFVLTMTRRVQVYEWQTCRGFFDEFQPLIRFSHNLPEEK